MQSLKFKVPFIYASHNLGLCRLLVLIRARIGFVWNCEPHWQFFPRHFSILLFETNIIFETNFCVNELNEINFTFYMLRL